MADTTAGAKVKKSLSERIAATEQQRNMIKNRIQKRRDEILKLEAKLVKLDARYEKMTARLAKRKKTP